MYYLVIENHQQAKKNQAILISSRRNRKHLQERVDLSQQQWGLPGRNYVSSSMAAAAL
jgi:hypothetical protein